jgi:hypothetical protein
MEKESKDWLSRIQENEWSDMSICRLVFQGAITMKIQLSVLV